MDEVDDSNSSSFKSLAVSEAINKEENCDDHTADINKESWEHGDGKKYIKRKFGRQEYDENPKVKIDGDTLETDHIIRREIQLSSTKFRIRNLRTVEELKHEYELSDAMYFAKCGMCCSKILLTTINIKTTSF